MENLSISPTNNCDRPIKYIKIKIHFPRKYIDKSFSITWTPNTINSLTILQRLAETYKEIKLFRSRILAASINGKLTDLRNMLVENSKIDFSILSFETVLASNLKDPLSEDFSESLATYWHTTAHLLISIANADYEKTICRCTSICQGGKVIFSRESMQKKGLEFDRKFFAELEKKIITWAQDPAVCKTQRWTVTYQEALDIFSDSDLIYNIECYFRDNDTPKVTIQKIGKSFFVCNHPSLIDTRVIKFVSVSEAPPHYCLKYKFFSSYTNPLFAISFPKKSMLTEYLEVKESYKPLNYIDLGLQTDLLIKDSKDMNKALWTDKLIKFAETLLFFMEGGIDSLEELWPTYSYEYCKCRAKTIIDFIELKFSTELISSYGGEPANTESRPFFKIPTGLEEGAREKRRRTQNKEGEKTKNKSRRAPLCVA